MITKDSKVLLINDGLKGIIDIFLGPFLISYLIKVSHDTINYLSIYNIVFAITLFLMFFLFGYFVKRNNRMFAFRVGIFSSSIYSLFIILFGSNIVDYVFLIGAFYGFSMGAYYLPHNVIMSDLISKDELNKFFSYRNATIKLVSILIPVLMGFVIINSSYQQMAVIIFVVCLIQFINSLFLHDSITDNEKLQIKKFVKYAKGVKAISHVYMIDILRGITITGGAYSLVVSLMQVIYLKDDFEIGFITSICSILALLISFLFGKYGSKKNYKKCLRISNIILLLNIFYLLLSNYEGSIVIYNFITVLSVTLFTIISDVEIFNVSNLKTIKENYKVEYFIVREFFLNLGRVIGFSLLLIVGLFGTIYLKFYLLFLTILIIIASRMIVTLKKML